VQLKKIPVKIKYFGILILLIAVTSCNYFDCNYEKLTHKEYRKIAELNRNLKRIDTIYNDKCLKGFFHVYLKSKSTDLETENEIDGIIVELKNENMKRDVWVFNNQEVFLYRLYYSDLHNEIIKTDLQYPNQ
jgi:hypothetical protein